MARAGREDGPATWARDPHAPRLTLREALARLGSIDHARVRRIDSYSWGPGDAWWVMRLELSATASSSIRLVLFAESLFSSAPEQPEDLLALDRWAASEGASGDGKLGARFGRVMESLGYRREPGEPSMPTVLFALHSSQAT